MHGMRWFGTEGAGDATTKGNEQVKGEDVFHLAYPCIIYSDLNEIC